MCPDQKLTWLRSQVSTQKLKEIKKIVIKRWTDTYSSAESQIPVLKKDNKVILPQYINYVFQYLF